MEINTVIHGDCIDLFPKLQSNSADLTLTDIPYEKVNKQSGGLRTLDKMIANESFNLPLDIFLKQIYRVTKSNIIIFCGKEQFSFIYNFFNDLQEETKGTVRQLIWEKTNPSPMNCKYIYMSGIENAVWFKKKGGAFNAYYQNTVFKFPNGRSKLHPTEKNHELLKLLIEQNSNKGDLVFDPCCGSGSSLLIAKELNRNYLGIEKNIEFYELSKSRLGENKNILNKGNFVSGETAGKQLPVSADGIEIKRDRVNRGSLHSEQHA